MKISTKDYINGSALYLNAALVYSTCNLRISGIEGIKSILESGQSYIVTSWHGMTMMVIAFLRKYSDLSSFEVIMPDDHRGRAIKVFTEHLGGEAIQLNLKGDSTMGSGRRLVQLVRKISSGRNFLIHPDGPEGPAYHVKPGLSYLAKKSGVPIVPLGCYCRHAYHVPRWDRYTLPLPFSTIQVHVGEPITIPKDQNDLEETNQYLRDILNRVAAQAAANYYEME